MAQLPPKIPSVTQNHWASFTSPHQRMPPAAMTGFAPSAASGGGFGSAWADEFMEFSSARRGAHRRSASDTIAFLDDDQLMSMFSDDVGAPPTGSNSSDSTPSDQNSNNDDQKAAPPLDQPKNEPGEVESTCISEQQSAGHGDGTGGSAADSIVDPKRIKRILANRQSAQRSRVRKLQYISELERSVTSLQSEVSALSPRVAFLDHQRLILNVDNSAIKQRIAALAQDRIFKDAHQEALKKEIERLRQVYQQQQNMKKMNGGGGSALNNGHHAPSSGLQQQHQQEQKFQNAPDQAMACTES